MDNDEERDFDEELANERQWKEEQEAELEAEHKHWTFDEVQVGDREYSDVFVKFIPSHKLVGIIHSMAKCLENGQDFQFFMRGKLTELKHVDINQPEE